MTTVFTPEIASVVAAVGHAHPSHPRGIYAIPWYLVAGDPGSGRSTAIHAMHLSWPAGDAALRLPVPSPLCTYWLPKEAVLIEPEAQVIGPRRNPELLGALCDALRAARPREAIDGILLVLNIADFADLDDAGLESYGNRMRQVLVEIGRKLEVDVPAYVIMTRYDTLWGFAEVFQWNAERAREDPWGFTLPGDISSQNAVAAIHRELDGIGARIEAFCLANLSSEASPDQRMRAFQHLAESRALIQKSRVLFSILAMTSAYERAPWFRALGIGSAVPGTGDKLRTGVTRFTNMGLAHPRLPPAARPGGLPIHALMKLVMLPERDMVPTRVRWRDDLAVILCVILGGLIWLGVIITAIVLAAR